MIFIGCFVLSIITPYLYNSTKGSLLTCILFHNAINTTTAYFLGNLKGEELRPLLIWILLLKVSAVIILFKTKGSLIKNEQVITTNSSAPLVASTAGG
jgi:hypothetical protein